MTLLFAIAGGIALLILLALLGKPRKGRGNTTVETTQFDSDSIYPPEVQESLRLHKKWDQPGTNKSMLQLHFSLLDQVQNAYSQRKASPQQRALCEKLAWQHVNEFSNIRPFLIQFSKDYSAQKRPNEADYLPRVPTFEHLATILVEKENYDKAIEVCHMAISFGLHDGTKNGYQGRIERIMKKKKAALTARETEAAG